MCLIIAVKHPDKVLATGFYLGYEWCVTNNGSGYRCGHIRVPAGHPWHGKDEMDIVAEVHGGLTFAHPDFDCGRGQPEDGYWIGFDCAHSGDAPDPELDGK